MTVFLLVPLKSRYWWYRDFAEVQLFAAISGTIPLLPPAAGISSPPPKVSTHVTAYRFAGLAVFDNLRCSYVIDKTNSLCMHCEKIASGAGIGLFWKLACAFLASKVGIQFTVMIAALVSF